MPDNRCVICQENSCSCGLDDSIELAASAPTGGYVATPDGPIHAGVARILLTLERTPRLFESEWFVVAKDREDADVYRIAAFTDPDREIVKWALQDGVHDLTFGLDELRELHGLLGKVLAAQESTQIEDTSE